ncbi:hypothetical protein C8039_03330 [Halogeometricum sp. wsp3]|nr:hypothetical protein C8039_03330 [Halogeometricum sp. wsp3]
MIRHVAGPEFREPLVDDFGVSESLDGLREHSHLVLAEGVAGVDPGDSRDVVSADAFNCDPGLRHQLHDVILEAEEVGQTAIS